jgi:hypothetical protein
VFGQLSSLLRAQDTVHSLGSTHALININALRSKLLSLVHEALHVLAREGLRAKGSSQLGPRALGLRTYALQLAMASHALGRHRQQFCSLLLRALHGGTQTIHPAARPSAKLVRAKLRAGGEGRVSLLQILWGITALPNIVVQASRFARSLHPRCTITGG